jgi:hypothetical protein
MNGYVSDHTRTFPVNGKFTQKQKDVYNIVLAAHDAAAEALRPGMMYQELSDVASRTLLEGLKGLDLVRGSVEDAMAAGAAYLFMPHGLGHGIGLDVHDCENIGERSFSFEPLAERAKEAACCITRQWWRLDVGTVLSDEPGIYFVPALIDKMESEGKYKGIVNYDLLESYRDFGGIRIDMPEGPVILDDMLSMFPFKNQLVYVEQKGSQIRKILEGMAARRFQVLGGVRVVAEDGKLVKAEIGGEPIDDDKIYGLATISFLLGGGDGLSLDHDAVSVTIFKDIDIIDAVLEYVNAETAAGRPIEYSTDGRVEVKGDRRRR